MNHWKPADEQPKKTEKDPREISDLVPIRIKRTTGSKQKKSQKSLDKNNWLRAEQERGRVGGAVTKFQEKRIQEV